MKKLSSLICSVRTSTIAVAVLCGLSAAMADTVTVDVYSDYFDPATVSINVNDTVHWTWQGYYHSTTSEDTDGSGDPLWDSGVYNPPYDFSYTFSAAGSFPYYCSFHYFYGTVNVQGASLPPPTPPTVAITAPLTGIILAAPATLTLTSTATAADASAPSVEFFQGTTSLGVVASSPYSKVVSNLPVGTYTFSAVATDDNSLTATNSITVSVIAPVALNISAPQRMSAAGFQFNYSAAIGLRYAVDRATVLPAWTSLGTNTAAASSVVFQDNSATAAASFYRVRQVPNP